MISSIAAADPVSSIAAADPMAGKILTRDEAIALTEKKVAMTLDEIIQMSKKTGFKGRRPARTPNKSHGLVKGGVSQSRFAKVQSFLNSRLVARQGVLAQRRSNFLENQFPLTTEVAKRATFLPFQKRAVNWNKPRFPIIKSKAGTNRFALEEHGRPETLDARFARMKEQRLRKFSQQMNATNGRRPNISVRNVRMPFQRRQGLVGAQPRDNAGRRYSNFLNFQ